VNCADTPLLEVLEPCARVKLGVDGVDDPRVLVARRSLLSLDEDDTNDWPWVGDWCSVRGLPSDGDKVAVVLDVKLLEVDRWLLALADHELVAVAEGCGEERECLRGSALRAGVDESVHALRVVGEVLGEGLLRELVAVVADELGVVVGDLLRLSAGHTLVVRPSLLHSWGSERANGGEGEEGQRSEGNHFELTRKLFALKSVVLVGGVYVVLMMYAGCTKATECRKK
jgi:hypothetical protein